MILFRERPGRPVPKAFPIRIPNVRKGLRDADCVSVRAGAFPLGGGVPSAYRIRLGPGTCFVRIRRRVILAGMGAVRKYTAGSASWAGADTVCRTVAGRYAVRCVYDMPVLSRFPGRCVYDASGGIARLRAAGQYRGWSGLFGRNSVRKSPWNRASDSGRKGCFQDGRGCFCGVWRWRKCSIRRPR